MMYLYWNLVLSGLSLGSFPFNAPRVLTSSERYDLNTTAFEGFSDSFATLAKNNRLLAIAGDTIKLPAKFAEEVS